MKQAKYHFMGFTVDAVRRRLYRGGTLVPLTAKAFDTLLILIERSGDTVSKTELMESVWSEVAVEENNLTQQISALRRAFNERPKDHRFIVTVPQKGYCFVAQIETEPSTTKRSNRHSFIEPAVLRGYAFAVGQIGLILVAFLWSSLAGAGIDQQRLTVLDFHAASPNDEFIGTGISQTLRARLGSVEDLVVRPQERFDSERPDVDTVVMGWVQRSDDRIRVVIQLWDVSDGRIIWGKTFDSSASEVFDLQDTISTDVARSLKVKLTSQDAILREIDFV